MKKIAVFSVFLIGLSLIVDINVAGPVYVKDKQKTQAVSEVEITADDIHFSLDTLQYFFQALQYFIKNANRIDLTEYEEYLALMNNKFMGIPQSAHHHGRDHFEERFLGEIIFGAVDKVKSFFGLNKPSADEEHHYKSKPKKPVNPAETPASE